MKNIFRNSKGELRLIWIWAVGIAAYYVLNTLASRVYANAMMSVLPVDVMSDVAMALADLVTVLPIVVLTVILCQVLHRNLLHEPMWIALKPLLIACCAALGSIVAAVLLLMALGKLRIEAAPNLFAMAPGELALTTACYALISISMSMSSVLFYYGFLCDGVLKRLDQRIAVPACVILIGGYTALTGGGGAIRKLNYVLNTALTVLALDLGGVGACCGVTLGVGAGLGVIFGSPSSNYVLMRIIPTSLEATIAPIVHDPLTGGADGAWAGLWLTAVLALLIAITLLCHAENRAALRALFRRAMDSRMGAQQ